MMMPVKEFSLCQLRAVSATTVFIHLARVSTL